MPTLNNSGSQTATIDTEHVLVSLTTNKSFFGYVDNSNVIAGDRTELRTKVEIKAAAGVIEFVKDIIIGEDIVSGAITKLWYFFPTPSDIKFELTLKQTDGTGRVYDWRVFEV